MRHSFQELYNYREMFRNLVKRDLRTRYKGSWLGFLWTFVNPLLQLLVFSVMFSTILRMNVDKYPMFLFVGLLPWIFFANTTQASTGLILAHANLVKKIYFPRVVLPLAATTAGLINLVLSLFVAMAALWLYHIPLGISLLALPLIMTVQYCFTLAFSLILSALNVYFRDLEHIWTILTMAWFYLTPIVYPVNMVPDRFLAFYFLNPMTTMIMAYQDVLYHGIMPQWYGLGRVMSISLVLLILSLILFNHLERGFAEEI